MKHYRFFLTPLAFLTFASWVFPVIASTIFCSGLGIYVTSNGTSVELAGKNMEFLDIKRLSIAPKFSFSASVSQTDRRGWCDCKIEYQLTQEIDLFYNEDARLESTYKRKEIKSNALPVDTDVWLNAMTDLCEFTSTAYRPSESLVSLGISNPLIELQKNFKPSHTCASPLDYEQDAIDHFGADWKILIPEGFSLIKFKDADAHCKKVCERNHSEGFSFCSKTDFP